MRVAIIGQQAFGAAVLETFVAHGHEIAAVFVASSEPGKRTDRLHEAASRLGIVQYALSRGTIGGAHELMRQVEADLALMAYVTVLVPQSLCSIPKYGTIQYHPSLLPEHRGPSAVNWAIIRGCTRTGVSIFRPVDGPDEGPIILRRSVDIAPDDTAGSLYFGKLLPLGVEAVLEAAEYVVSGRAIEVPQDLGEGSYESWVRDQESEIHWGMHVDYIYDLVRGCDPAPGAWTWLNGTRLRLYDATRTLVRTFAQVRGKRSGTITAVSPRSFTVQANGGFIEVGRCRLGEGDKISAGELGLSVGMKLGPM